MSPIRLQILYLMFINLGLDLNTTEALICPKTQAANKQTSK